MRTLAHVCTLEGKSIDSGGGGRLGLYTLNVCCHNSSPLAVAVSPSSAKAVKSWLWLCWYL